MVFVRPTHLSTNRALLCANHLEQSAAKPMSLLSVLLRRIVFFRGRADPPILLGYRCFSRRRIVAARIKTARSFHAPFSISLVKNTFFFSSRGLVYKSIAPGRSRNSRFAAPRNQPVIKRINLVKTNEPRVLRPLRRRFPVRTVFVLPVTLLIVVSFKLVQDKSTDRYRDKFREWPFPTREILLLASITRGHRWHGQMPIRRLVIHLS